MEGKRKINPINITLIVMLVMCLALGIELIMLSKAKIHISKIEDGAEKLKNNYTQQEQIENTWDISATDDDKVTATLLDDGTLRIFGNGNMKDFDTDGVPWEYIIESITSVKIEDGVTNIGDYAFAYCYVINIEIGSGVTKIGGDSFFGCTLLENINVSENNISYMDENGILYTKDKNEIVKYPAGRRGTSFIIPNDVTKIGYSAFEMCYFLFEIEIPSTITTIESYAFYETMLNGIKIPNSVTEIEDDAFEYCSIVNLVNKDNNIVEFPDIIKRTQNETDILYSSEEAILENCTMEEGKVKINENVEYATIEIQNGRLEGLTYVFAYNTWDVSENGDGSVIATLDNNGVLTVSGNGNMGVYGIQEQGLRKFVKSAKIEDEVTSIGAFAFGECINLTNIEIGRGVTQIVVVPFLYCLELKNINVDENNTSYTDENGILYTKDKTKIVAYPAGKEENEFKIPSTVTQIGEGAFAYCYNLKNIEIPNSVTSIDYGAFAGCIGLKTIKIPKSVTEINGPIVFDYSKITILCYSNSYAETYAKEHEIMYKTIYLSSAEQNIDEINLIITKIQPKTTIQKLKTSLLSEKTYEIIDKDGNVINDSSIIIKMGYKLKLEDGDTYTLVVTGDVNGDGQADLKDILAINKHRLNKVNLGKEYILAGDINEDGQADIKDILQINKFRLGKIGQL